MPVIRKFILFILLLSSSWSACAAQPTTESIESLLRVTKVEAILESLYVSMEAAMRQAMVRSVADRTLTPAQKHFLDHAPQRYVAVMREELSWASVKPLYIQIYQENFSQEEIDGLVAFYDSPVGRTTIEKLPAVMQQSMMAMQDRIRPFVAKMQAAVDQSVAEAMAVTPETHPTPKPNQM
jgi:hypothetical protein